MTTKLIKTASGMEVRIWQGEEPNREDYIMYDLEKNNQLAYEKDSTASLPSVLDLVRWDDNSLINSAFCLQVLQAA